MAKFGRNNRYKNMTPADFGVLLVNNGDSITVVNANNYGMPFSSLKTKTKPKKFRL